MNFKGQGTFNLLGTVYSYYYYSKLIACGLVSDLTMNLQGVTITGKAIGKL